MAEPELTKVFEHIEANTDRFIARLLDYLKHPSISALNIGMSDVAQLLVKLLSEIGLKSQIIETPGYPIVLGRWDKAPGALTVLLYGHYDVMPADPNEGWTSPPFEPTVRNGRVYARGAGDNKGQHFAQILALESYLAVHGRLPCNVVLLLEGEEETGSPNIAEFIRNNRDLVKADLVFTADGPMDPSGRPIITYGVRGLIAFELRAHGANRDVHSGNLGGIVPNPLWTLVHLLATMKNENGEITVDGFYDDLLEPTQLDRAAAQKLPFDADSLKQSLGLTTFDAPLERPLADRLMFFPTLTINGLHGGYGGAGSKTVLPNEAVAKCDTRLVDRQDPNDIIKKIEAHVKKHAPNVDFVVLESTPPSKTPIESPFSEVVQRAVRVAQGVEPLIYPALGATLPDFVFTKILGTHSFVVPYANADEANHAPDENIRIDCFLNGIRTGAALLSELGKVSKSYVNEN